MKLSFTFNDVVPDSAESWANWVISANQNLSGVLGTLVKAALRDGEVPEFLEQHGKVQVRVEDDIRLTFSVSVSEGKYKQRQVPVVHLDVELGRGIPSGAKLGNLLLAPPETAPISLMNLITPQLDRGLELYLGIKPKLSKWVAGLGPMVLALLLVAGLLAHIDNTPFSQRSPGYFLSALSLPASWHKVGTTRAADIADISTTYVAKASAGRVEATLDGRLVALGLRQSSYLASLTDKDHNYINCPTDDEGQWCSAIGFKVSPLSSGKTSVTLLGASGSEVSTATQTICAAPALGYVALRSDGIYADLWHPWGSSKDSVVTDLSASLGKPVVASDSEVVWPLFRVFFQNGVLAGMLLDGPPSAMPTKTYDCPQPGTVEPQISSLDNLQLGSTVPSDLGLTKLAENTYIITGSGDWPRMVGLVVTLDSEQVVTSISYGIPPLVLTGAHNQCNTANSSLSLSTVAWTHTKNDWPSPANSPCRATEHYDSPMLQA